MKKTICLNMIVRDESDVILRCLESVYHLIDYWVIVDTGSKDNTPELIETFFKEKKIPGELHLAKWVNFEKNRNQALRKAKGHSDYILFIDADEQFTYEADFKMPLLEQDSYMIRCNNDSIFNERRLLVRSDLDWEWRGVIHETVECEGSKEYGLIEKLVNFVSGGGGARSQNPRKTREKDIRVLNRLLKKNPKDGRALYYLGMTYMMLLKHELALKAFKKRAKMKDYSEEWYLAHLYTAKIMDGIHRNPKLVFKAYLDAVLARPQRVESYFYLARYLRKQKDLHTAFEVAKKGMEFGPTKDQLAVESKIYEFGMVLEYSVIAVGLGMIKIGREEALKLLERPEIPEKVRLFIENMWAPRHPA